jgi:hypothetical protein
MKRLTKLAVSMQGEEKTCCVNFMGVECIYRNGECGRCSINDQAWDKLRRYEELEEQGRMIIHPVNFGDTVFRLRHMTQRELGEAGINFSKAVRENDGFYMWRGKRYHVSIPTPYTYEEIPYRKSMLRLVGKKVFLTREEAEKATGGEKK